MLGSGRETRFIQPAEIKEAPHAKDRSLAESAQGPTRHSRAFD